MSRFIDELPNSRNRFDRPGERAYVARCGENTNGGVEIELAGSEWVGESMNVETTNGRVEIRVPENYSARLETATTNGDIRFDFPVMVQGKLDDRVSIDLGDGGNRIRAVTTNGGVRVRRG